MSYLVILDGSNQIQDMFNSENNNVPPDAISVSDADGEMLRQGFADYKLIGGMAVYSIPQTKRLTAIKQAARAYILASYPDWKQANMTARMLELVNKKLTATLTADELAEEAALIAAWDWVKAVRGASNVAEQTAGMTAEQIVWPV